ncbi:MAG: sulfotransferase [Pirellulales bacterium]
MSKHRRNLRDSRSARVAAPGPMVDKPTRRLQAALSFWKEDRHADALELFEESIRQDPNNVRNYVLAARAYSEKCDFERMERIHDKLTRRAPRHPGVHHYIGETFGLLKLPERAIASYKWAAALPGAGPPTWMELASLYERAHRLDEAEELIERTVRSGYNLPIVSLVRGRIQRRQKRLADAEATLLSVTQSAPQDSDWTCQAWSELALMRDSQGDYGGAIEAIGRCKQSQRLSEGPCLKASDRVHEQMRELIDAITRDDFRRWREEAVSLPPRRTALLTGFPRSGTTLLEQLLDAHPELVSSEERDFVGRELFHSVTYRRGNSPLRELIDRLSVDEIRVGRERYFAGMEYLLGESIGERMHLDKNPAYNLTIPLMLRVFPETRLIVALRDPRDVVLSCYLRYLPINSVSVRFLDIARTANRYALDMSAWLKFRQSIEVPWCEVRYEDTVRDAESQARRALETLGLPWDEQVLGYRQRLNAVKQVTSPSYEAVAQPIYTRAIGRWRNYEQLLEPAFTILEPFVREFGYE